MATATFSIAAGADDQSIERISTGTEYPPGGTITRNSTSSVWVVVQRRLNTSTSKHEVDVGLLRWDTSSLPDDAVVSSATLRLRLNTAGSPDGRNLVGEWYAWTGSSNADHTSTAPASPVLSAAISGLAADTTKDFTITDLSGISKSGTTSLRLHVSGGQPTTDNYVTFYPYEHATEPEAQLIVTYTTAGDLVGMTGI